MHRASGGTGSTPANQLARFATPTPSSALSASKNGTATSASTKGHLGPATVNRMMAWRTIQEQSESRLDIVPASTFSREGRRSEATDAGSESLTADAGISEHRFEISHP